MGADNTANGRVTTREHYQAQMDTQRLIHDLKDELMIELKPLSKICNQVDTNKEEIDKLRNKSNLLDIFNGFLAVIGATVAAMLGRQ